MSGLPRLLSFVVIAGAIAAAGCGGEAVVEGGAATLFEGPIRSALNAESKAELPGALRTLSAKSGGALEDSTARTTVVLNSEGVAARTVQSDRQLTTIADQSAAEVQSFASQAAGDRSARERVESCTEGGVTAAAESYTENYVANEPPPNVYATLARAIGECLQEAYPDEAATAGLAGDAIADLIAKSTEEVSFTDANAQDYADWLVYTAPLYTDQGVGSDSANRVPQPSDLDVSVAALLIAVFDAHPGRVAAQAGDWDTAIQNRGAVLDELDGLDVSAELEDARQNLLAAMRASLNADEEHQACGSCGTLDSDLEASAYKRAFVQEFNPYVEDAYGVGFDETYL